MSPRSIHFVKASACGNDFLLIDSTEIEGNPAAGELADLTRRLCDRHNGVGADGVEWIYPHDGADAEIRLINADGSEAEISGNGTRCVAAYLCGSRKQETVMIQTGAGPKTCTLVGRDGMQYLFETSMGEATVGSELAVPLEDEPVRGIPVSMGNPHYVLFVREFATDWQARAAAIQSASLFQHGVNVEMVVPEGMHDIRVRFFERGAGETQSSGTGSCAAAVAAVSAGRAEFPVEVHAEGGSQTVSRKGQSIVLRGPARMVCRGEFFLD